MNRWSKALLKKVRQKSASETGFGKKVQVKRVSAKKCKWNGFRQKSTFTPLDIKAPNYKIKNWNVFYTGVYFKLKQDVQTRFQ